MSGSQQQQSLYRKIIYSVAILALITGSLLHRRLGLEPMANSLQLREVARGEVELTSSAVRLLLTGSRGLAVTFLWHSAMDKQIKHEWNELELLVTSITKLQPHFISPWLFQSWNMSFNVAVECDRPRDKYYYISRGLEMLAEGERRNFKPPAPGNPDMRHHMGFTYQLKIGNSDEKNVMRCLLEMSCIDPLERNPEKFWRLGVPGEKVNLATFYAFCEKHPRLVRRLAELLPYNTPEKIVRFLEDNKDIPSRFQKATGGTQQTQSLLKEPTEQFPLLPPPIADHSPDPRNALLTTREAVDVFLVCRTWYEYAQEPLPPPDRELHIDPVFTTSTYRKPRYMMIEIFRGYPARAQSYIAETLESDGWFDSDGWVIRDWFERPGSPIPEEKRVGTEIIYHAGPAWDKAYQMYKEYGTKTGLYFAPAEIAEMEERAKLFRSKTQLQLQAEMPDFNPALLRDKELARSFDAHRKLVRNRMLRETANYDAHLNQADAERKPATVFTRKMFYRAERLRRFENPERALALYKEIWPLWTEILLAHPDFAKLFHVQEDSYELAMNSMRLSQKQRPQVFSALTLGIAQMAMWPPVPLDKLLDDEDKNKILPIRNVRSPLEWTMYYAGDHSQALKTWLVGWTHGTNLGLRIPTPHELSFALTTTLPREMQTPPYWRALIEQETVNIVRSRIRVTPTATERKDKK